MPAHKAQRRASQPHACGPKPQTQHDKILRLPRHTPWVQRDAVQHPLGYACGSRSASVPMQRRRAPPHQATSAHRAARDTTPCPHALVQTYPVRLTRHPRASSLDARRIVRQSKLCGCSHEPVPLRPRPYVPAAVATSEAISASPIGGSHRHQRNGCARAAAPYSSTATSSLAASSPSPRIATRSARRRYERTTSGVSGRTHVFAREDAKDDAREPWHTKWHQPA